MSNINTTDIHNLRAEIQRLKNGPWESFGNDEKQALFEKIELALIQIIDVIGEFSEENIRLKMSVEELKTEKPLKQIESSYLKMILNKVEILRNIVKESTGNKKGELFSGDLIAVESIEKDIVDNHVVSKDQMRELNKIYQKYTQNTV